MKEKTYLRTLYTAEGERLKNAPDEIPWTAYPRPHLERSSFLCLNGTWEFCTVKRGGAPAYDERIRVPFVPQSVLSNVGRAISQKETLCYRRSFDLPEEFLGGRVLLHFGAVDQIAEISVNGQHLLHHEGGYEHFSVEITDVMKKANVVEVAVTDHLDDHVLPYGKQKEKRGGMWYTPIAGIWQTVWLECVPANYIRELSFVTDLTGATLTVEMSGEHADGAVALQLPGEERVYPVRNGSARIDVPDPILWSPENPHLYRVTVTVGEDRVSSYFALRTLEIKDMNGVQRLCLNGKPYFFHGLLDQGYFSDGIFLPASPKGFEEDVLLAKRHGFNMLRKHIKIEPECFYYDCDRLGMVVFQDMVNNGDYSFLRDTVLPTVGIKRMNDRRMHRHKATRAAFLDGMKKMVAQLRHHPSICYWTIFNEGWGQFDHAAAYRMLKELDDTRFIDSVSGWFVPKNDADFASDVESHHVYFKPVKLPKGKRPVVLSEFGGYSHRVLEHSFNQKGNYGYRTFASPEAFADAFEDLYRNEVLPAVRQGLCAAVYTQLTDVEDETNGLITYDRRVEKINSDRTKQIAERLFAEI